MGDMSAYLDLDNVDQYEMVLRAGRVAQRMLGFSNRQAGRTNGTTNPGQQRPQNGPPVTGNSNMPSNNAPAAFPVTAGPTDDTTSVGSNSSPEPVKLFFIEDNAKLGVKGNMMPLAATPAMVDVAEWLAHQTVEQYRILENFIQVIQEFFEGKKICNPETCPTMSAGRHITYTWLNNEGNPIPVPACQYIMLVQRWVVSKIHDPIAFPTDSPFGTSTASSEASYPSNITASSSQRPIPAGPTTLNRTLSDLSGRDWFGKAAGFPEAFLSDVRTAWRQMFRIYAHLYHGHYLEPFWHIKNACNNLNSAFCFFASVGKLYGLLGERDLEPMVPLINIWVANGSIPADCASGAQSIAQ
ncbi:MAG: hypothetical protein Q9196_002290 [Gyalolechia fulgens]